MKILIIKFGAAGDVLRTTGLLAPLKRKYPGGEIHWLVAPESAVLLMNNPDISDIKGYSERARDLLTKNIINEKFDLVINLEEEQAAAEIASAMKCEKAGFVFKEGEISPTIDAQEMWKMSILGPRPDNDVLKKNNKKTYQRLIADIAGLDEPAGPPIYLNSPRHNDSGNAGDAPLKPLVGINFGAGTRWPTKRMPLEKVKELISRISSLGIYDIAVFGGTNEEYDITQIRKEYPSLAYWSGMPIHDFAEKLGRCACVITTDTLALHMSLAVGSPVVALFGPTSFSEVEIFDNGYKVRPDMGCLCCYKKECPKKPLCMESFNIDEILALVSAVTASKK